MEKREGNKLWKGLFVIEQWALFVLMAAVSIVMFGVAVLRYVSITTVGFEEIIAILAIWLYFIGAAYTSRTKSHMVADFIDPFIKKPEMKSCLTLYRRLVTVILNAILLYWAIQYFYWQVQLEAVSSFLFLPLIINYMGIVLGLSLIMFYECVYLYDNIKDCYLTFSKKASSKRLEKGV